MMKPNRLLLAALALLGASAAFAQSSVTIYGRVNTTIERQKEGDAKTTGLYDDNSRWGIRGVEDLGGGLKAGFTLESGFNVDTGAGSRPTGMSFNRQSEVNLSGGFGMVRLGNFFPESYFATVDYSSLHNHDTGSSEDALFYDPVWFGPRGTGNKASYRTPNFGGVTVEGTVSLHEQPSGTGGKNGYDLAANYTAGPLHVGFGYTGANDNWGARLQALYNFGPFTVAGYYERDKDENLLLPTGAGSRNNFRLAGMYVLGASEFHVNVGRANKWSNVRDSSATQWTLGYNYNLSKRTKLYGYYTRINNSSGGTYGPGGGNFGVAAGDDFSSFALGIRHNF